MSNLSRDCGRCCGDQLLLDNSKEEYNEDSVLSCNPSLHMDPSPEQNIISSFAVEGGEEDKEVIENHVGQRQLLPLQTRVSQGKGGEEDFFDQSFIDAGNNTFHQPS
jgi:hypothetical protein